jgi:hypothetical protein
MHRFKGEEHGHTCKRFRDGCPTEEDFEKISRGLVAKGNPLPKEGVRVACKTNAEREAISVMTWLKHIEDHGEEQGLIVLADNVVVGRNGASLLSRLC